MLVIHCRKMSRAAKIERRRLTRIKRKAIERKDLFALDYIRHKYPDVYNEAARICELLNNKYPNKFDLRRTAEHRAWKKNPEQSIYTIQQPICIPPDVEITVTCQPVCPQTTESTSNTEIQSRSEPPTSPDPSPCSELPISHDPPSSPESTSNPNSSTMPEPPAITRLPLRDNMQLLIPLLKAPAKRPTETLQEENTVHPVPQNHPSVTTETLQVITEEVLQEDSAFQSLDEIDPEAIEKIINELRTDPDLRNTFNDIEEQIEFQELGMDLEIPEDMLEKELENWEFW